MAHLISAGSNSRYYRFKSHCDDQVFAEQNLKKMLDSEWRLFSEFLTMVSVGRNEPCPCGSGIKFKKCCLPKHQPDPELLRRCLRQMNDQFIEKLMRHSFEVYGELGMHEAWSVYWNDDEKRLDLDLDDPEAQSFLPWYLYDWIPSKKSVLPKSLRLKESIARNFLGKSKKRLTDSESRFLEAIINQPQSFHEVLECDPGTGFLLKDILTGQECYVLEKSGSSHVRKGEIFFARIVALEGIHLMIGCGATPLPPIDKIEILDLKDWILKKAFRIGCPELRIFEEHIRETYVSLRHQIHFPPLPVLSNTDGEALSLQTLYYEIPSGMKAVKALQSLALGLSLEELLEDAKYDKKGEIEEIEFPWLKKGNASHKNWENTVLAHITIRRSKMEVQVNSQERASRIKKEIHRRMKGEALLKRTMIQSGESLARQAQETSGSNSIMEDFEPSTLDGDPVLQKETEKFFANHWKNWLDEKIPILDGLTPRQAVKKQAYRERLQALLTDFERKNELDTRSRCLCENCVWN